MGRKKPNTAVMKSQVVNFYGTKAEWLKAELNMTMDDIFKNGFKEKAVVAEDENGLYVTGKSYVGALVLDPYRMYDRIVPEVSEDGSYNIKK